MSIKTLSDNSSFITDRKSQNVQPEKLITDEDNKKNKKIKLIFIIFIINYKNI